MWNEAQWAWVGRWVSSQAGVIRMAHTPVHMRNCLSNNQSSPHSVKCCEYNMWHTHYGSHYCCGVGRYLAFGGKTPCEQSPQYLFWEGSCLPGSYCTHLQHFTQLSVVMIDYWRDDSVCAQVCVYPCVVIALVTSSAMPLVQIWPQDNVCDTCLQGQLQRIW